MTPNNSRQEDRSRWSVSPARLILLELVVVLLVIGMLLSGRLLWASNQPPRGQECGTIRHVSPALGKIHSSDSISAVSVINCFWRAYQTCRPATLVWNEVGADDGSTNTLIIFRQEKSCLVYGHDETFVNTNKNLVTFTCSSMIRAGERLSLLKCSDASYEGSTIEPPLSLPEGRTAFE